MIFKFTDKNSDYSVCAGRQRRHAAPQGLSSANPLQPVDSYPYTSACSEIHGNDGRTPLYLAYRSVFPDPQPAPDNLIERDAETLVWLKDYFQLNIDLVSLYKQWAEKDRPNKKPDEKLKAYYREADILTSVRHPNIIGLERVFVTDNTM